MRLIDADALMKVIREHDYPLRSHLNSTDNGMFTIGVQQAVDDAPAIDAVEVVHGEWIREDETQALLSVMWHCSECKVTLEMNGIYTPIGVGYKFCPNCGAKMDKRGESEGK